MYEQLVCICAVYQINPIKLDLIDAFILKARKKHSWTFMRRNDIPADHRSLNKYLKSLQLDHDEQKLVAQLSDRWELASEREKADLINNTEKYPTFAAYSQGSRI